MSGNLIFDDKQTAAFERFSGGGPVRLKPIVCLVSVAFAGFFLFYAWGEASDKLDPFLGLSPLVFAAVLALVFFSALPGVLFNLARYAGHVMRERRLRGYNRLDYKLVLPAWVVTVLFGIKLVTLGSNVLLIALMAVAFLASLIVPIGDLPQVAFKAFISCLVWSAMANFLSSIPLRLARRTIKYESACPLPPSRLP